MFSSVFEALNVVCGSPRYNSWLYSHIERHLSGLILDVGSGLGDIARQFDNPRIAEVILSDHAEEMIKALEKNPLPLKKYRISCLDIANPQILVNHPPRQIDTITCINVLEHIQDDLAALKNMKHLIKKGGKVIIFVPALPVLYGTLDVYVKHHRRYTKRTLRFLLEKAGFKIKNAYYVNLFGILTWFLAGRVLKQKRFHKNACRMLDRVVPVLRAVEHCVTPPLGQSLIMVGES